MRQPPARKPAIWTNVRPFRQAAIYGYDLLFELLSTFTPAKFFPAILGIP